MQCVFLQPFNQGKFHYGGENGYAKTCIADFPRGNSHFYKGGGGSGKSTTGGVGRRGGESYSLTAATQPK